MLCGSGVLGPAGFELVRLQNSGHFLHQEEPDEFNRLARSVGGVLGTAAGQGVYPAVATSGRRRRFLRHVLEAKGIDNPVLSFE